MSRAEKAARAAELYAQGMTGARIAEIMGISQTYTYALLNDPDGTKERKRKRSYDKTCVDCGGRVSGTDPGKSSPVPRCSPCSRAWQHETRHWTPERVIAEIRARAVDGVPPSARVVAPSGLLHMAQREFGTWNAAVAAAGFDPRPVGVRADPDEWYRSRFGMEREAA